MFVILYNVFIFCVEFMQNEQYPYNLNFNDSLTELSPEETEQFLEDAFSLSSKSPLSDDLTESSISLQNSPGEQINGEEYLYYPTLSEDIKQEELSPANISEYQFENVTQTPIVSHSVQNTNGLNHSITDMQSVLQQHLITPNPPQDISSILNQGEDMSASVVSYNRKNVQNCNQPHDKGEKFPTLAESLSVNKKSRPDQKTGPLAELLKTSVPNQLTDNAGKQRHESKKKPSRAKRQKSEAKDTSQDKTECYVEAKSPKLDSSQPVKDEKQQQAPSQTVSQVLIYL